MVRSLLRAMVDGPAATRVRRFVAVGTFAAGVQTLLLALLVEAGGMTYLVAAALAIEFTIVMQYVLNNAWTFQTVKHTTRVAFLRGLLKTNLVRGTAIPIQLAVLWGLVRYLSLAYLLANGVGIVVSGVYRYALDSRWTWSV